MAAALTIRPLDSNADFEELEEVQRAIWPGSELIVVPMHLLTTVAHNGGLVLGAFDEGHMVGFVFGFLGTDDRESHRPAMARLKCCSHQLGVVPEYRDQGVGRQLKLAQRRWALDQGVRLVTWTFDPLESRNANLNIARLGCVSQTYKRNVYGEMGDELNRGLPSDRFQVDWWITSNRVKQRLSGKRPPLSEAQMLSAGATVVNPPLPSATGWPAPPDEAIWPDATLALVEIPGDFQSLKQSDRSLAFDWRLHTREVFERLFDDGYIVTDFIHQRQPFSRGVYLLARSE